MAEPAVRQRTRSPTRKAQLLDIAAKIFAEEGYKETGIESILKLAGLTGPALYRHFKSKQEILDTICITAMQNLLKLALDAQADQESDATERVRKLLGRRLDYLFAPTGYGAILAVSQRAHLSENARERVLAMQREFRAAGAAMLKEIRPKLRDGEVQVIFFAMEQMTVYSVARSRSRNILSPEEHRELLEKVMWDTLMG